MHTDVEKGSNRVVEHVSCAAGKCQNFRNPRKFPCTSEMNILQQVTGVFVSAYRDYTAEVLCRLFRMTKINGVDATIFRQNALFRYRFSVW